MEANTLVELKGACLLEQGSICQNGYLASEHSVDFNNSVKVINKQSNSKLLKFAKACAIRIYRPNLCIQKEMVVNLSLPWWHFMYILRLFIIKVLVCFIL